jgi:hypothetical protein
MLTGLKEIGMFTKAMMAVRRLVISPPGGNQQSVFAQQSKQPITTYGQSGFLQQPLQLSCSDAGL